MSMVTDQLVIRACSFTPEMYDARSSRTPDIMFLRHYRLEGFMHVVPRSLDLFVF